MSKHGCVDGVLDDAKYSSTMPVIGIYIAAATLVCLSLIISDIVSSIRTRKRWLPCRLFSLNSVTLTLLAVVAKLPVDLTTAMPSAQDQLSKLTGTAVICVSMGVFRPSIGTRKESECLANMIALSIFVITVVVNICMQLYSGVIFLFTAEHIIIMCCMLGLLLNLWFMFRESNSQKKFFVHHHRDLIKNGTKSMLQRLKTCYLYGFDSNPQFVPCKDRRSYTVSVLCMVSSVVVIQAAFRSFVIAELKFCKGVSDYGFTMWLVVITQILTIVIGGSATTFRWISMLTQLTEYSDLEATHEEPSFINPLMAVNLRNLWVAIYDIFLFIGHALLIIVCYVPGVVVGVVAITLYECCIKRHRESGVVQEYKDLLYGDMRLDEWTIWKCVDEMKRWTDLSKRSPLVHLFELVSRTRPSQQLHTLDLKDQVYLHEGIQVSLLTMTLLVRICDVSIPSTLGGSLVCAFGEAYEILLYINDRVNFLSDKNRIRSKAAKRVWRGLGFQVLLPDILKISGTNEHDIDHALIIIRGLKQALPSDALWDEVGHIVDFLDRQSYSSIKDLYDYMEQVLVDMFHLFLAQLPDVIYHDILDSSPEEYEERVRLALKHVSRVEPMEALVQWAFPVESNISSLISTGVSPAISQNGTGDEPIPPVPTHNSDVIVHVNH